MELEGQWRWKVSGDGRSVEMEGRWRWKVSGEGRPAEMEGQWSWKVSVSLLDVDIKWLKRKL